MTARVLVVQHEDDDPIHLLGDWMAGVEIAVCRPYVGDAVPESPDGIDGLVVMGGAMGAHDDQKAPWLPATRELIRLAAAVDIPTLGICLGHQLCAVALGGDIWVNPNGRQLGLLDIGWTTEAADDELMGDLVGPRRAMHWNDDVVVRLPEGATQLATASTGEVQAARHAPSVWGIQWHPEVDDALVAWWAQDGGLSEAEEKSLVEDVARSRAALDEWWRPLGKRFAALVTSTSSRGSAGWGPGHVTGFRDSADALPQPATVRDSADAPVPLVEEGALAPVSKPSPHHGHQRRHRVSRQR